MTDLIQISVTTFALAIFATFVIGAASAIAIVITWLQQDTTAHGDVWWPDTAAPTTEDFSHDDAVNR